ncbi:MAG: hypothetical protein JXL82_00730 [Candidatus Omnitrophica bacterium]|nr:hypothetical protein [Candidatus Omnitrophota bacterium]
MIFNSHQICVLYLSPKGSLLYGESPLILDYPGQKITQVFWHSDSYHLIMITDKNIAVIEADINPNEVSLVNLNKSPSGLFYDPDKDSLYFSDYQTGTDGVIYENIYKLELSGKQSVMSSTIRLKQNGKE